MNFNWGCAQRRLRARLIQRLSDMSKNGWRDARPEDYKPLERQLNEMKPNGRPRTNAKIRRNRTRIGMTEC